MRLGKLGYFYYSRNLSKNKVRKIRSHVLNKFGNQTGVFGSDSVLQDEVILSEIINFKEEIQKKTNENIYLSYDLQLHINRRDSRYKNGWHIDGAQEIAMQHMSDPYVLNDDYQLFKVGIYLQLNDKMGESGGIDVKTFSLGMNRFCKVYLKGFLFILWSSLKIKFGRGKTLKIQPGDAVLFDSRLIHRSTPICTLSGQGLQDKIVIYFNASFDKNVINLHHKFMMKMALFSDDYAHYRNALNPNLDEYFSSLGVEFSNLDVEDKLNNKKIRKLLYDSLPKERYVERMPDTLKHK